MMLVENRGTKTIKVKLVTNKQPSDDRFANEVIVIGQTRGIIYYEGIHDLSKGNAEFSIDNSRFPSGIAQITVFSSRAIPLAERLVFIRQNDDMKISFKSLGKNEDQLNQFEIETTDNSGKSIPANLSFSIVNAEKFNISEYKSTISEYLLLTSDLKGYINNPDFYFEKKDAFTNEALDNLMLTQGWRRFDWNNLVNNQFPELDFNFEKNIEIEGIITRELFDIPLKNCEVTLSVLTEFNDVFRTRSAKDGSFTFDGLVYYDTVDVKIEARKPSGRKNLVIVIPEPEIEKVTNFYGEHTLTTVSKRDQKAYRKKMNELAIKQLKEEEKREEERNKLEGIYGAPDNIIRGEDIPDGYSNVLQAIQGRVPGVDVRGNNVIIRGVNSFYGSTDPLFLLDGVPVIDVNAILSIPITDVDRIEILKGPSAAIFGSRGANGVIAVYTKRGEYMKKG
ncbi:MAG: TonB-dependent receptor plug domain-containing protein [Bacteroidales bacterium]|nr:TonB-dependent receptor plug domain-containing protein [Bacteroidales bacterium]